ncbi:unnamed protein product, partial [Vitis vinifera]
MNNLKLYSDLSLNLELRSAEEVVSFSAFDIERNRLVFASSDNFIYTTQLPSSQNERVWGKTSSYSKVEPIDLEPGDFITAFDYLMEKEALIVGTSSGLLLLHNVDDNAIEVVGRVEGGVKCISPSPDGDLLGIITGFGQIVVMTHDWDVLYENTLDDLPEDVDLSEPTFSSCYISWRGDGKYFVTLGELHTSSSHKKLKVWERDTGALHAASESKAFMGTVLDWMPSGAKIASVYDKKVENECPLIVFFERNGLERSSFSINELTDAKVEILKWNCSSDLLAAVVRSETFDSVKIWFFSNNHWYLKQEIRYLREDGVKFMWHPTKPLQLICWTLGGEVTVNSFVWVTAVMENSTALVIDESKILATPLSLSLMPPPMYLFNLKFSSTIRDIAFYTKNSKNLLAAFLSDGCLCVAELPPLDTWEELEGKELSVDASSSETIFGSFVHLIWLDAHILLGVSHFGFSHSNYFSQTPSSKDMLHGYYLQEIELLCSEDHVPGLGTCSGWHAKITNQIPLDGLVIGLAPNPTKKCSAFVQLHVGGKIICNNCRSFSFYSNSADLAITHLILATKQDLLFVIDIDDILDGKLEVKYENFIHAGNKRREEDNRNFITIWERGAKVIGVLHGDEAAVILQTARGNLECIYPRKLVLASIINALVQSRFRDGLLMVRRHRIDFNVIVDHCGWQAFLQSAAEFVRQVNNLSYITEFVCSIKNETITETLYKNYISLLCLREAKDVQAGDFKGPNNNNKVSSSYPSAEEALKHLLWLSDSEAVYEASLGLYDLHLAAIVALNSQRDPKEFLPFLQELERMPVHLMRYNIDIRLRRYESALKHIASAGDAYYADCLNLMKENPQLFPLGLQLITDPAKKKEVLEAWGDHFSDEKCFEDAATTYLCCSGLEKALKAYRACGNWGGVMTVAGLLKLGKEEIVQLANELCEELQALGKPGEAAKIALDYCGDVKSAINLLVSARDWEEALRVAFMHRCDDLISEVQNASLECATLLIGEYEEGLEKVGKYLARYLAVRQRRLLLAAKLQSEDRSINDLDDDTASEASSSFSGMSAYTTGTRKGSAASISSSTASKGRGMRRQRNRGKIRAGSPGEEMALVEHLKGMYLTPGAERELKSLLVSLVVLGKEEMAKKLQRTGEAFQLSQMAAVKLAEDTMPNDNIDEYAYTLENYIQKLRNEQQSDAFVWRSKVLLSS